MTTESDRDHRGFVRDELRELRSQCRDRRFDDIQPIRDVERVLDRNYSSVGRFSTVTYDWWDLVAPASDTPADVILGLDATWNITHDEEADDAS